MAGKKITELISGSLQNLPLSGVTTVVYSGTTFQHNLTDLREKLVDSGSHNFKGDQIITGSLTVSGSQQFDLHVIGRQLITAHAPEHTPQLWISGSDANTVYGRYTTHIQFPGSGSAMISPGEATFIKHGTDSQLFEIYNDESSIALRTDASGSYIADYNPNTDDYSNAIKFQPVSNYQNGLVSILRNTDISGSLTSDNIVVGPISEILSGSQYTAAHIATSNSINITHFEGNNQYYSQVNITNTNSGNNASSDLVLTADNGNETVHFVDLGINSSTYTGGLVGRENDAYLLNVGKDLYIGTVGGTNHPAKLYLFAENNWENPQITVHTGSQVTFNTPSFTEGYTYEFSGLAKFSDGVTVDEIINIDSVTEKLVPYDEPASQISHNFLMGSIAYVSNASSDLVIDVIEVPTTDNKAIGLTVMIEQGSPAYKITGLKINSGSPVSISWYGGSQPTGTINSTDIFAFSLIKVNNTWRVFGQKTTF
jgi:hypothetical protein